MGGKQRTLTGLQLERPANSPSMFQQRGVGSSDMRRPMSHRMNDEPEVMGILEPVLVFVFLFLAIIAALMGLF